MSENYGMTWSFDDAIEWVELLEDPMTDKDWAEEKDRTLARMRYEADKARPLAPVFHKGHYGHKYDHYTCKNCGFGVDEIIWNYCPNCGRKLSDAYAGRRKTQEEQERISVSSYHMKMEKRKKQRSASDD